MSLERLDAIHVVEHFLITYEGAENEWYGTTATCPSVPQMRALVYINLASLGAFPVTFNCVKIHNCSFVDFIDRVWVQSPTWLAGCHKSTCRTCNPSCPVSLVDGRKEIAQHRIGSQSE